MPFRERLEREFAERRAKNARYSLRAFAAFLGADHSTLSQILRGARGVPVRQIRAWSKRLGLSTEEIAVAVASEHAPDPEAAARQERLRHWTAEAAAVVNEPAHWEIVRLSREPGFRPDTRWVAAQARLSVDAVNVALSRLLRLGLLEMLSPSCWRDASGAANLRAFRKTALERVRLRAAEQKVQLLLKGTSKTWVTR